MEVDFVRMQEENMLRAITLSSVLLLLFSCSEAEHISYNGRITIPMKFHTCLHKKNENAPLGPNTEKLPLENKIAFITTEVEGRGGTFWFDVTQDKDCPTKLEFGDLVFEMYSSSNVKFIKEKIYPKVNWDIKAHIFMYYKNPSTKPEPYEKVLTIPLKFTRTDSSIDLGKFEVTEPKE